MSPKELDCAVFYVPSNTV